MKVLTTIRDMRSACRASRSSPAITLGLVPTMGALHEGHLSLVRAARAACDVVAVSIFVNPTQFGPNEDLARYPRTFEADCAFLETAGVDFVFAPAVSEIYPSSNFGTFVEVPGISDRLDGGSRPGHFRGVTTVVSKLFGIVSPDRAFFGQKDAAQVAVLQAMVRDLDLGVELVICPTARDADGLALSSRNRFLTPAQRSDALILSRSLACAEAAVVEGERDAHALKARMLHHLAEVPAFRVDYVEAVDRHTLLPQEHVNSTTLLAVAGWLGDTRLIDNLPLATVLPPPVHKEQQ
ncbi:MAG: pantoate--beta-alanine ligase [Janthinobacterium lividum]